jgi:3-hydroxyisobutyrate dehydrogenase-like beta-hydroxyacid dehydrogenase
VEQSVLNSVAKRETSATVAVLYPGEMGAAVARLLRSRNIRVVTTLLARGEHTARRCRESGITVLDSLAEVVAESNVVISLVPPARAEELAASWCELAATSPRDALYVDANSIGPALAQSISRQVSRRGRGYVDAAINGLAANAATSGTMFLSGPRAVEVAELFDGVLRVQLLGDGPAAASAMKMALGGLAKGLCSLFAETAQLAARHEMLPEMLEATARIYPGIYALVERMLPTYAVHASRRATEMAQVEQSLRDAGVDPVVLQAVRQSHEQWAATSLELPVGAERWTAEMMLQCLLAAGERPCMAGD